MRALLPGLWTDPERVRVAYAVDATASELTWIAGPPLALTIGAVFSPGAAIAAAAAILLAGTAAFALQPASRRWRPEPAERRGGSMRAPGMRTLVLVLLGAGALFGAVEVAVAAAAGGAAAPLLGLWGAGSLLGGALATRLGGGAGDARGLIRIVAALAAGHLALVPAAGSTAALAAVLFVAGAAIAPTFAIAYGMVERVAPAGTVTEAFSWLATALAVGSAAGSAAGGALTEHAGPAAALLLAGVAGVVATIIAVLRATSLNPARRLPIGRWSSPARCRWPRRPLPGDRPSSHLPAARRAGDGRDVERVAADGDATRERQRAGGEARADACRRDGRRRRWRRRG